MSVSAQSSPSRAGEAADLGPQTQVLKSQAFVEGLPVSEAGPPENARPLRSTVASVYSQEPPLHVEVASTKAGPVHPDKVTAKMGLIMDSADQIGAFIDGQMVTSDSNRSRSEGDDEPVDMSRMGDDAMGAAGDFGNVIKDSSHVTGGRKLKSRYNHAAKPPPSRVAPKASYTRTDLANIDIRVPGGPPGRKGAAQPSRRNLLAAGGTVRHLLGSSNKLAQFGKGGTVRNLI